MKYIHLLAGLVAGSILFVAASASAQVATNYFKLSGSNIIPVVSSWTVGSSTTNGAFNNLTISGTCTGCGAGAVSSVSNSDGTLTISPTTGAVVGSLNLGHANTWTGLQTFNAGTDMLAGQAYKYNGTSVILASTTLGNYFFGGAGNLTMTGGYNTASGLQSLYVNSTGFSNTGFGYQALPNNNTGFFNAAFGRDALALNIAGYQSAAFGANALFNSTGSNNTGFGYQAGYDITSGTNNVILGTEQATGGGITTGSNNIMIGTGVRSGIVQTGSNQLNIGNLLFGTSIGSEATLSTGNIGIGTSSPSSLLSLAGTSGIFASTTATSTFQGGGINLVTSSGNTGCFAINGTCLSTGSGTVTSVGATVPTGWTVTGSPITTSGTLGFDYATGYAAVKTASTTNWNNFYNTPSTQITAGTGLSWSGNTLNTSAIPNASLANSSLTVNGTVISLGGTGTITAASSTLLANSNTFSGVNSFTNASSNFGGTWQTYAPSHFQTALGFTPANQTTTISTTYPLQGGGDLSANRTFSLAFGTTTSNTWAGTQTFTNPITVNGTAGSATSTFSTGISVGTGYSPYPEYTFNADTNTGIDSSAPDVMNLVNGGLNTMTLTSTNKVGIGTTSPYKLLSIGGDTVIGAPTAGGTLGNLYLPAVSGILKSGTGGLVSAAANGTDYTLLTANTCTNQAITALSASGGSTCSSITDSFLSGAIGNTHGGTGQDSSAWSGIPMISAGTWYQQATSTTAHVSLGAITMTEASTTQLSSGTNTFYVDPNGRTTAKDTTNAWSGVLSPTVRASFTAATSTATWTATSTPMVDSSPVTPAPFAGTLHMAQCNLNTFLGVKISINGTAVTPSYFIASSTVGNESITANNTFARGDKIEVDFGTTTTAVASSGVAGGVCNLFLTETP